MHLTDDVLHSAQRGNARAFEVIWTNLAPAVNGYLTARGVTDPEAVTSDVFVTLLPQLERVVGGARGLRTLVFSIAHARVVDEYRKARRRPDIVEYDPTRELRVAPSAETVALDRLGTERVLELLAGLTDDQREVLILRLVGDLSVDQVAEVLGRSAGAIKQLQRRGLVGAREALADEDVTL